MCGHPPLRVGRYEHAPHTGVSPPSTIARDRMEQKMMMTEFFMAMDPPTCTYQEKQVAVIKGKPVFYDSPKVKAAKQKLIGHLMRHRPGKQYEAGVRLVVRWCFPRVRHADGEYRITKPDTDNLQKMLKDCMTICGYWRDDALVASELTEKFWADIPGIYIRIEELE